MSQTFDYLLIILACYLIVGWCLSFICLPIDSSSTERSIFNFLWIILIPIAVILWLIHIMRLLYYIWKMQRDFRRLHKLLKSCGKQDMAEKCESMRRNKNE